MDASVPGVCFLFYWRCHGGFGWGCTTDRAWKLVMSSAADGTRKTLLGQGEAGSLFSMNLLPSCSPCPRPDPRGELDLRGALKIVLSPLLKIGPA